MSYQDETQKNPLYARPVSNLYSFYLFEVGSPESYADWFETMRQAGEHDLVKIHINSPGGNLNTTIQLMRCMAECQATVVASVEGECMSAATMVLMQADMAEISDHSMFMFHNYSGGAIGKGGEIFDKVSFEKPWIEGIMRDCYEHFLSDEEIEKMLDGKDYWMDSEEVTERLQAKAKIIETLNDVKEGSEVGC
jgi:ATP-dependent Clp protease protease subunit